MSWTIEQVEALSPDAGSLKRGKGLAVTRKWELLAIKENAIWGLCKGSGKNPYKTQIDLTEPAFKCSCPSRKFPCKHSLGLMMLYATDMASFQEKEPLDWVKDWLEKRQATQAKKADKTEKEDKPKTEKQLKAQAKRKEKTLSSITDGLEDLDKWLQDIVRLGTNELTQQDFYYFDDKAKKLANAKAGGIVSSVKDLSDIMQTKNWEENSLEQMGYLYLLSKAFKKVKTLNLSLREDVKSRIGIYAKKEAVLEQEAVTDTWHVLGKLSEIDKYDAQISIYSNWLLGEKSQRIALVLEFKHQRAAGTQLSNFVPGTCFEADMCFFPGYPIRAILKSYRSEISKFGNIKGFDTIELFLEHYTTVLKQNPFITRYPCLLNNVRAILHKKKLILVDSENKQINIKKNFQKDWELLAVSGGHPITIFGRWENNTLYPISMSNQGSWNII